MSGRLRLCCMIASIWLGACGVMDPGPDLRLAELRRTSDDLGLDTAFVMVEGNIVRVSGVMVEPFACTELRGEIARTGDRLDVTVRSRSNLGRDEGCPDVVVWIEYAAEVTALDAGPYTARIFHSPESGAGAAPRLVWSSRIMVPLR